MKLINEVTQSRFSDLPERILQFGEGNFLRGFVDWMVELANRQGILNSSIVICQPLPKGNCETLDWQSNMYTLVMNGMENKQATQSIEQITSISRCINPYADYDAFLEIAKSSDLEFIVSNTTEAGIQYDPTCQLNDAPQASFPAKMTRFLYERYVFFNGDHSKTLIFFPCELIDSNADTLRTTIIQHAEDWNLPAGFIEWIGFNQFCNTMVDRIVTGFPSDIEKYERLLGYKDKALVCAEKYNKWVIEAPQEVAERFPLDKTEANVVFTMDVTPHKLIKVRIMNGTQTAISLAGILAGLNEEKELLQDDIFHEYMNKLMFHEIIPTLALPEDDKKNFAITSKDRFNNPGIFHALRDISLNSFSKYATRCLPTILSYYDLNGTLPKGLVFGLASMIRFYHLHEEKQVENETILEGITDSCESYQIRDSKYVLSLVTEHKDEWMSYNCIKNILKDTSLWNGHDISKVPSLLDMVYRYCSDIDKVGVRPVLSQLLS